MAQFALATRRSCLWCGMVGLLSVAGPAQPAQASRPTGAKAARCAQGIAASAAHGQQATLVAFRQAGAHPLQIAGLLSDAAVLAMATSRSASTGFFVVAATSLKKGDRVLFQSDAKVTVGATYGPRAIKATVSSKAKAKVTIWTGKAPKNLFLNRERVRPAEWAYDAKTQCLRMAVPEGTTEMQIRFDNVQSLKPVEVAVPLVVCDGQWTAVKEAGKLAGQCANERIHAKCTWQGQGGLYRVRAKAGPAGAAGLHLTIATEGAISPDRRSVGLGKESEVMLETGSMLSLDGEAVGPAAPLERVELQLVTPIANTITVDKAKLDLRAGVLVEGEAFTAEGGGQAKKSREHKNTHAGGCIFTWANPGHWIAWQVAVPKSGRYLLTVVAASAEHVAVRSLRIDGRLVPGAGLVAFSGTGGWGRSDPKEWQAFRPVDGKGKAIAVRLEGGKHEVRMENALGQHMNVDYLLLSPCD